MLTMPAILLYVATVIGTVLALLIGNTLWTTLRYNNRIVGARKASKDKPADVPVIPYTLPILGSTIAFSTQKVGTFWTWLAAETHRQSMDAVAILLNGKITHLVHSQTGVLDVFRARQLSRFKLDQQLGRNCLGMSKEDAEKAFPEDLDAKTQLTTERIHSNMLLAPSAVNALTTKFMEVFEARLESVKPGDDGLEIDLYAWLRDQLFHASTTALCGSKLLEMFPEMQEDFWHWDDGLLAMLFGTPRLFALQAYASRDKLVSQLEQWLSAGYAAGNIEEDKDWEPSFGAKVVRKRHDYYKQQGMSLHAQAGADLIFLGGILSNAIPATGWMLMHILSPTNPPELFSWVMDELKSAQQADGSVDVPTLVSMPLLNSMFHETLRLYIDLLVVRQVDASATLGPHIVSKDEMVMVPSWLSHRNAENFVKPGAFDPARFLVEDPETGKLKFSINGLNGKYFPFGGGHYMCPGRTFAKQEVLGSIAVLLLNFDVEVVEFVKKSGSGTLGAGNDADAFPRLKEGFAGNVVVGLEGDMRVKIRRKL